MLWTCVTVTRQTGYTVALIVVSTHWFWGGKLREAGNFAKLGVDGFLVNKMGAWTDLAQDRDRWWAVVNAAMKLRVP